MTLYRIAKWAATYETHETRKLKRLDWVPMPNKHDGLGFRQIAAEKDGPQLLAAWLLLVQLASKSDRDHRGILIRDDLPLSPDSMALMTGFGKRIFERALSFFSQAHVGWLIAEHYETELPLTPGEPGENPDAPGKSPGRMEGNGREWKEGNGRDVGRAAGTAPAGKTSGDGAKPNPSAQSDSEFLDSLRSNPAYRGIDVDREHAKMQVWCAANKKQPSRRRLINWLNRVERPLASHAAATAPRKPSASEPPGWREYVNRTYPESVYADGGTYAHQTWDQLDPSIQRKFADEIAAAKP